MFINEVIWMFVSSGNNSHNNILWYSKGKIGIKNTVKIPHIYNKNGTYRYWMNKHSVEEAERRSKIGSDVRNTWIDIPSNLTAKSVNSYPTEKPYRLLERIILLSTK